ncbi:MAG: hypothetical protein ACK4WK_07675, partial [Anaerolineae bacterium]
GLESFSPTPMLLEMRHFPAGAEGQAYWYHLDGRGSVAGLTKHQGQSTHNYRYDAYGFLLPATGSFTDPHNHYTFIGKEWDEHLGLYEFGYFLSAEKGRALFQCPALYLISSAPTLPHQSRPAGKGTAQR